MNKQLRSPDELLDFRETDYLMALYSGFQTINNEILTEITQCYTWGIRIGVC